MLLLMMMKIASRVEHTQYTHENSSSSTKMEKFSNYSLKCIFARSIYKSLIIEIDNMSLTFLLLLMLLLR